MNPNEGRLQTGEHILARIVEDKTRARVIVARFGKENEGSVDFFSEKDLRGLDLDGIEKEVNFLIRKHLPVKEIIMRREDVKGFDLSRIPPLTDKIRIIEIKGFDKRPCRDPHVNNTNEIGYFNISKTERVGKDRYRMSFSVRRDFLSKGML